MTRRPSSTLDFCLRFWKSDLILLLYSSDSPLKCLKAASSTATALKKMESVSMVERKASPLYMSFMQLLRMRDPVRSLIRGVISSLSADRLSGSPLKVLGVPDEMGGVTGAGESILPVCVCCLA